MDENRIIVEVEGKGKAVLKLDTRNPRLSREILAILPLSGLASTWLEEVFFTIETSFGDQNLSSTSAKGDFSYWEPGPALCFFLGESQPYSPVNHLGKVILGLEVLSRAVNGDRVFLRPDDREESP